MRLLTDRLVVLGAVALLAACPAPDRSGTFEDNLMTRDGAVLLPAPEGGAARDAEVHDPASDAGLRDATQPADPDGSASDDDGGSAPRDGGVVPLDAAVDSAVELDDAGGDPELDAGDAPEDGGEPGTLDAGDAPEDAGEPGKLDAAGDGDAGGDDADAGHDPGPPFACDGAPLQVSASALPVVLSVGNLRLVIEGLTNDASFRLCEVPSEHWPRAIAPHDPLSGLFAVETDAATFSATLELTVDAELTARMRTGDDGFAPVVPRVHSGGATLPLADAVMSDDGVLSGSLTSPGFVYFGHLDANGSHYALDLTTPVGPYVTGEVIPFGFRVDVLGTPTLERSITLTQEGCNVEPIGPEVEPEKAACGLRERVTRQGDDLPELGILAPDSTLDMTTSAYGFFCPFAGEGELGLALRFWEGTRNALTVHRRGLVQCTHSLDLVLAANRMHAESRLHGPIVPTFLPEGVPLALSEARLSSPALLDALMPVGVDGVFCGALSAPDSQAPAEALMLEAQLNSARLTFASGRYVPSYAEATIVASEPGYADIDAPYYSEAGGSLLASRENAAVEVLVSPRELFDVHFGAARGPATQLSFRDGTADVVHVRALASNGAELVRWVRPSDLALVAGRRSFALLSAEQTSLLSSGSLTISRYQVGFLNVQWDEQQLLWPEGRVLPVAGGTVYELSAEHIAGPTDQSTACAAAEPDPVTGCARGPLEVLVVGSEGRVEMFSPLDGAYLGTLIDAGESGPDGFVQLMQSKSDHCLYASQRTSAHGSGIFRYDHQGALNDSNPLGLAGAERPYGLSTYGFFAGDMWIIAREQGGVLFKPAGAFPPSDLQDPGLSVRGVEVGPSGVYASGKLAGDATGSIRLLSGGEHGNTVRYFRTGLAGPEQVTYDPAGAGSLLVALSEQPGVAAYDFDTAEPVLFIDDAYSEERPRGVYPLLNGQWLVAGDGLGVDVLMPGTHVRYPSDTPVSGDSAYISRVCLPE